MSKTTKLFDLLLYVNTRYFTANDVAEEFDISVRTAHRYLLELEEMGVPLYTEQGRNGGCKKASGKIESTLLFWNHKRDTDTPLLKLAIQKATQKKIIEIKYQSKKKTSSRTIAPIGVYANHGIWYMPAHDCQSGELRITRCRS